MYSSFRKEYGTVMCLSPRTWLHVKICFYSKYRHASTVSRAAITSMLRVCTKDKRFLVRKIEDSLLFYCWKNWIANNARKKSLSSIIPAEYLSLWHMACIKSVYEIVYSLTSDSFTKVPIETERPLEMHLWTAAIGFGIRTAIDLYRCIVLGPVLAFSLASYLSTTQQIVGPGWLK